MAIEFLFNCHETLSGAKYKKRERGCILSQTQSKLTFEKPFAKYPYSKLRWNNAKMMKCPLKLLPSKYGKNVLTVKYFCHFYSKILSPKSHF